MIQKKLKKDIFANPNLDGNAFFILGAFSKQAKREGWSQQEIDAVVTEAKSGDYDHLLQTLMGVIE